MLTYAVDSVRIQRGPAFGPPGVDDIDFKQRQSVRPEISSTIHINLVKCRKRGQQRVSRQRARVLATIRRNLLLSLVSVKTKYSRKSVSYLGQCQYVQLRALWIYFGGAKIDSSLTLAQTRRIFRACSTSNSGKCALSLGQSTRILP